MRIGQGFDAHRFSDSGRLVLGGIEIPFDKGMLAHSDGDVVIHALCDAILGALALGDIGQHFPDSDPRLAGISSRELLRKVVAMLRDESYAVVNVDLTIVAEAPRIATHVDNMCANVAEDTGLEPRRVNVKATTTERLGCIGRGEGIAAFAVAAIQST